MKSRPVAGRVARQRIIAVLVVLAAATVIYQQTIPLNRTVRARLSQLIVTQPGAAGYKEPASTAKEIPNSSSPFGAAKSAAKSQPGHTGGYARVWSSTTSKYGFAEIVATWLPTTDTARTTLDQAVSTYLGKSAYAAENFSYQGALTASGIPGSRNALYQGKATKTTPPLTLAVTVFRQGLVVVAVNTLGPNPSQTRANITSLAHAEAAHLSSTEPGFTLTETTRPPLATAIFAAATIATAAAALFGLTLLTRARRRRQLRRAVQARQQARPSGQKVVKHQRSQTR